MLTMMPLALRATSSRQWYMHTLYAWRAALALSQQRRAASAYQASRATTGALTRWRARAAAVRARRRALDLARARQASRGATSALARWRAHVTVVRARHRALDVARAHRLLSGARGAVAHWQASAVCIAPGCGTSPSF